MSILRIVLVVPAFLAAIFTFHRFGADTRAQTIDQAIVSPIPVKSVSTAPGSADVIIERRLRIEGLLSHLDQVAAVAMQMKPEEADRLEPVIVDLAERTLGLVDANALADPSADGELEDLEATLGELMRALTLQVQTETVL